MAANAANRSTLMPRSARSSGNPPIRICEKIAYGDCVGDNVGGGPRLHVSKRQCQNRLQRYHEPLMNRQPEPFACIAMVDGVLATLIAVKRFCRHYSTSLRQGYL